MFCSGVDEIRKGQLVYVSEALERGAAHDFHLGFVQINEAVDGIANLLQNLGHFSISVPQYIQRNWKFNVSYQIYMGEYFFAPIYGSRIQEVHNFSRSHLRLYCFPAMTPALAARNKGKYGAASEVRHAAVETVLS
jgi:hypothetical protein